MGILIDSNIFIALERGKVEVASKLKGREDEQTFISVVTASELLHGVHWATSAKVRSRRQAFVEAVLDSFSVLGIDLATARCHAELWGNLQKRGKMIGIHDSWLAATCLAHGLAIVTNNEREFRRVPGLIVELWSPAP